MGIGKTNAGGAGGAALNFKVVGGTAQPTSPKENMFWVNTQTKITSYVFSTAEPKDPSQGMVWIATGASSSKEFNALKKNGIYVYPQSAKQYIDGVFVEVPLNVYQNGEWIIQSQDEALAYWIENGVVNADIGRSFEVGTSSRFTFDDTVGYFEHKLLANQTSFMRSNSKVNVSDYKYLVLECEAQTGGTLKLGISTTASESGLVASAEKTAAGSGKIKLNIESYDSSYYLFYQGIGGSDDATAKVSDIYFA